MKVNKTQALLFMLMTLLRDEKLSKAHVLQEIDISDLTFRRYMQELRAFLYNFNTAREIEYNRHEDTYYLK